MYGLPGDYTVELVAITPAGCKDTVTKPNLIHIEGPIGTFDFVPKEGCPGTSVLFGAQSPNTNSFSWDFGDGSIGSGANISHVYSFGGTFRPILILEDGVGCQVVIPSQDSVFIYEPPEAGFIASDSLLCDQGIIQFTDTSISTASLATWEWDFGDGTIATGVDPTHTYTQAGYYNIQLIIEDVSGCADTTTVDSVIRVVPSPQAMINVSDSVGCAPFALSYADASILGAAPIDRWKWLFGTNDSSDTAVGQFFYGTPDTVTLSLLVQDSLGCRDTALQLIRIIEGEGASFSANDSLGCVPQDIAFTDLSSTAVSWAWNFGDGSTDTVANPVHTFDTVGDYSVQLIIEDVNGCVDTLVQTDFIRMTQPFADFSLSDSVLCPGDSLLLTDQSISEFPFISWEWNCSNGGQAQGSSVYKTFANSGLYDIELVATDNEGCTDTLLRQQAIRIRVDQQPAPLDLHVASIQSYDEIQVKFEPYTGLLNDFGGYTLYRQEPGSGYVTAMKIDQVGDTAVMDMGFTPDQEVYCYKVSVENVCGTSSDTTLTAAHCTIGPDALGQQNAVLLNWSPYQGWPGVDVYNIYQVFDYRTGHNLIGTVNGNVFSFTDTSAFCPRELTYRIEAVNMLTGLSSWSDTVKATPVYTPPQLPMDVELVTVENSDSIKISWGIVPPIDRPLELLLERNSGPNFSELVRLPLQDQGTYTDHTVDVNSQSYAYQLRVIDVCRDRTPPGKHGTSVFAEASREATFVRLKWNPYEEWETGVAFYRIEFFNQDLGTFQLVAEVSDTTEYLDSETFVDVEEYCYRITAFENGGNSTQSVSNIACVKMESFFYTPNAFTPNGDGRNDRFLIQSVFVENYVLQIYDRWGRMVFESLNPDDGWDGNFEGRSMQEGVYIFVVNGTALDGRDIKHTGSLTLIR